MLLLALDTSTRYSSLALCTENAVLAEYSWFSGNNHSTELLVHLQQMLSELHINTEQLDVIAVASGPGSFNGVRVALSTAKALAFSLQKPLIGVSTLDSIAMQQQHWRGSLYALLEAGRGELYGARYQLQAEVSDTGLLVERLQRLSDYFILKPQQIMQRITEELGEGKQLPLLFCGEISPASQQALRMHYEHPCFFVAGIHTARRASLLALLALQRLEEGRVDNPLTLEPLYLRRPSITKSTRKQPLLGEASQIAGDQDTTEREEGALHH